MNSKKNTDFDFDVYLKTTKIAFFKAKKEKTFFNIIAPILECLKKREALPYHLKQWIYSRRSMYLNKMPITKEEFNVLETINPFLDRDWKVRSSVVRLSFEQWIEELTESLDSGIPITTDSRLYHWLSRQRTLYYEQTHAKPFSKEKQAALDTLIPRLGYDWKTFNRENKNREMNAKKKNM